MDHDNTHGPTHRGAGVNLHDPAFARSPRLRSLKRQVPVAAGVFVMGLLASMTLLAVAMDAEPRWTPGLVAAGVIFTLSVGYAAYVTMSLARAAGR